MYNDYMYAIDRSDEYLEHYGIKGMKWGVRKAIERGGTGLGNRRLARQYRKAQKKLAKLEKRANSGAKYARRAAALGAGAAAAGGLALAGTTGISNALSAGNKGINAINRHVRRIGSGRVNTIANQVANVGSIGSAGLKNASQAVSKWGNTSLVPEHAAALNSRVKNLQNTYKYQSGLAAADAAQNIAKNKSLKGALDSPWARRAMDTKSQLDSTMRQQKVANAMTKGNLARAGAAAVGLGLAGAAGYNAYRAATTKRAAQKAADFRKEMNKTFAGTAYGKQGGSKKRRRR